MNTVSFQFAAAAVAACLITPFSLCAEPLAAGAKAPEWELVNLDGKKVKSSDFAGKVVVLDFWATWCPPCVKEIPSFIELQKQYSDKGLTIVGVSLDQDPPEEVKNFVEKHKMNYPVVMGDEKTAEAFGGIEAIPTTFVIDRDGRVVSRHVGYTEKEVFEKEITPLL
jgi:peroxiredoxin